MKRWTIVGPLYGNWLQPYTCSLLSLAGKSKIASFKSDCGHVIHFQFMKFFDYSKAKAGNMQTGWCKLPGTETKVRTKIVFKEIIA